MTLPNGADGVTGGWPLLTSAEGHGTNPISGLGGNDQDFVVEVFKETFIGAPGSGTSVFTDPLGTLAQVFGGLTTGLSLPMAILKKLADALGLGGVWTTITDVANSLGTWGGGLGSGVSTALTNAATALSNIQSTWNNLFDGASGSTGSTGKTLSDMLSAVQTMFGTIGGASANADSALAGFTTLSSAISALTPTALTAQLLSALNTITLGIRTNKSAAMGANPTSQTSITAGHFSSGGSLLTSTVAAGTTIGQRYTVPEDATYGFVDLLVSGTSVTNIFLNILKIDPATNAKTALFNSSNLAAVVPSSLADHTRILLPGMPATSASDELIFEIVNGGTNALTSVTKATAMPNNSHEVIQNVGFSRSTAAGGTSPASLTSGQGSYASTVPYAVIGLATVPADYHLPDPYRYPTPGSYSLALPAWLTAGDLVNLVGVGGGGGGGSSFFYVSGGAGLPSTWQHLQLVVGTDILAGSTISIVVGARGNTGGSSSSGGPGGNTTFTYLDPSSGSHTLTSTGGAGGAYGGTGGVSSGPGNDTFDGQIYYGGAGVGNGSDGQAPGGGGGGAVPYLNGTYGGAGEANLVFKQA